MKKAVASAVAIILAMGILFLPSACAAENLAFRGAEGFGRFAKGGQGGDVYRVKNLRDSGPGSLRHGIEAAKGPRTILFDVSGMIDLQSPLRINKPFLTITGEDAPEDGVTIKGDATVVQDTHDVIVRYLRFRTGDVRGEDLKKQGKRFEPDALAVVRSEAVIIDHVSASWGIDETLSVTFSDRVTVQWCLITESLHHSFHHKGAHGMGSLIAHIEDGGVTFHHNLYAHHNARSPRAGSLLADVPGLRLDFVNNVIYNWRLYPGHSGGAKEHVRMNYTSNYLVAGPSTTKNKRAVAFISGASTTAIHQSGNFIDSNRNGERDGVDTGWDMFRGSVTKRSEPFDFPKIEIDDAKTAYERVLAEAGASKVRDAVDKRIINEVKTENGSIINSQEQVGGWPELRIVQDASATPPPAERDRVTRILDKAKQKYDQSVAAARDTVVKHLEKIIVSLTKRGDLEDAVEARDWKQALSAEQTTISQRLQQGSSKGRGKNPVPPVLAEKSSVERYLSALEGARGKLQSAYDKAVHSYTKKGDLDNALAMKEEKAMFVLLTTRTAPDLGSALKTFGLEKRGWRIEGDHITGKCGHLEKFFSEPFKASEIAFGFKIKAKEYHGILVHVDDSPYEFCRGHKHNTMTAVIEGKSARRLRGVVDKPNEFVQIALTLKGSTISWYYDDKLITESRLSGSRGRRTIRIGFLSHKTIVRLKDFFLRKK